MIASNSKEHNLSSKKSITNPERDGYYNNGVISIKLIPYFG